METTKHLLNSISQTVLVCDGSQFFSFIENHFIDFLKHENISFETAENLYNREFDLSLYPIIAFSTMGVFENRFKKLMDFDKKKLKTVIVLNDVAFYKTETLAKSLNIELIGFNWLYWDVFKSARDQDSYNKILFDPYKKWKAL